MLKTKRKLAAIMAVDVVGFSRLMGEDETGTLERLKVLRRKLVHPKISEFNGRIVKLMGDGLLAEFSSIVEATQCAIIIQQTVNSRELDLPEDRRVRLRIGVNLGDIIVEGSDIYGDGVNVAARLECLAEPGGICITRNVFEEIKQKLPINFEDLGEKQVKNIIEPIRVYRWHDSDRIPGSNAPDENAPAPLPDKPSIAVLPFDNMSGDPNQEYFSDGITEDIITELSRFQSLTVIARNSTFTYKGTSVNTREIGQDLGVHYIVEGSVRKAGDRVRVTVQLIEAESGNHIWAERYDRELIDIFDIQDELTQAIVATLPGRIESASVQRIKRSIPTDLGAYERVMHAKILHHRGTREDNIKARQLLNEAIELDSDFASAYAWKACVVGQGVSRGYIEESEALWNEVRGWSDKGYLINENDLECVRILCEWGMADKDLDKARQFNDKAFKLNPNDPRIVAQRGELLVWMGEAEEALTWVEKAMKLDPYHEDDWAHLLGFSLFGLNRYKDAIRAFLRVPNPKYSHCAYMAACHAHLEEADCLDIQVTKILKMKADFSAKIFVTSLSYRNKKDQLHLLDGLLKAGLPE